MEATMPWRFAQSFVSMIGLLISFAPSLLNADTITFDGILSQTYSYGAVPANFDGYHWQNFSVFVSTGCTDIGYVYTSTGYCRLTDATGITSQGYLIGDSGTTLLGTLSSDTPFTFNSGVFAAAWNNDVVMTVTGYRSGKEVATGTYALNTGFDDCVPGAPPFCQEMNEAFPPDISFGWQDVDTITFQGVGGHSDGVGSVLFPDVQQAHVIIGNLNVTPYQASEPNVLVLLFTGLAVLLAARKLTAASAARSSTIR
jgi:hypothetical protein